MPVVNIQLIKGLATESKRKIAEEITHTLVTYAAAKPERTHVIFHEIDPEDWGFEGRLVADRRKTPPQ